MNRQRIDAGFEIKSISDAGEFSGYGSVFDTVDSYGDSVIKGAFANSLEDWREKGRMPSLLWQHDTSEPIGIYTDMREDDYGLYVEGKLLIDADPLAKRAHAHLKAGSISGMSIGFNYVPGGLEYNSEDEVYIVKQVDLWEVSLVTFPANDEARVSDVKSMIASGSTPDARTVERALRDVGFSQRQAKIFMSRGYDGISERDVPPVEEMKSLSNIIFSGENYAR